jgi:uncharacterized protein YabE (DUF348 family)
MIPPPGKARADASRVVSLYFDGQKKVITTNAPTVAAALQEAGVNTSAGDLVEPAPSTQIPQGFFNINVYRARPVVVIDGDKSITVLTAFQSPRLIAEAAGLTTYDEDSYDFQVIHRAVPVLIEADGKTIPARTQQKTVGGLLDERDVALGPQDTVTPDRNTAVTANIVVHIVRVKTVQQEADEPIAFTTSQAKDPSLDAGQTKVQTAGVNGVRHSVYLVHYQDGVEQSRQTLAQNITLPPVNQVIVIGTKINYSADPVILGQQLAAARGWTGDQWSSLYNLWERESGWNPSSHNLLSGACGIPQANPCSKIPDHSTAGQIQWGLDYIAGRYGSPESAWAYWQNHHSY